MRRTSILIAVLAVAGCMSAEQQAEQMRWQQMVAQLPPSERTQCQMAALNTTGAWQNPNSMFNLVADAAGGQAQSLCLTAAVQRRLESGQMRAPETRQTASDGSMHHIADTGRPAPARSQADMAEAFLAPYFVQHGRNPVMECGRIAARVGGSEAEQMEQFMGCVTRLPRI